MSWRTSRTLVSLRSLGRRLGLNRLLVALFSSRNYEDRFQAAMLAAVRPGDVVWDVGANVGHYTTKFSRITGPSGTVYAFEPSVANLQSLHKAVASLENVTVLPIALGKDDGVGRLQQGHDSLGATSRLVECSDERDESSLEIQIASGDRLVSTGGAALPNVVKIDAEGFELEILSGLRATLRQPGVRVLCVEVHFGLLHERGLENAPAEIESLLGVSGFAIAWPDASHIVATRTP